MRKSLLWIAATVLFASTAMGSVIFGNPSGKVVLTKYFDYECPHCRTMSSVVDLLADKNSDLKVVSKVVPMLTEDSWFVARAALASRNQGMDKFNTFNAMLMSQSKYLSPARVLSLAEDAGLDIALLKRQMKSKKVNQELRANLKASHAAGVRQIPTILVAKSNHPKDAKRFVGAVSFYRLQSAVNQLR